MECTCNNASKPENRGKDAGIQPLVSFAASSAAVLGLALGIAWPLWSLALSARSWYNALFAASLIAMLGYAVASRVYRRRRRARIKRDAP
jgi:hypothetical protein